MHALSVDPPLKVMVIEGDPDLGILYEATLSNLGFDVTTEDHGARAIGMLATEPPDLTVIFDHEGWMEHGYHRSGDGPPLIVIPPMPISRLASFISDVMNIPTTDYTVYLEIGEKRTFAGAIDWPGWCRRGRDEESALQALLDYAPRYAAALEPSGLGFAAPADRNAFTIVERLPGSSTTDFGAPGEAPAADSEPITGADITHFEAILRACWQAFDAAIDAAAGHELRKGPRGGGRDREAIIRHVLEADQSYLGKLGAPYMISTSEDLDTELTRIREAILDGLSTSASGSIATQGPRGGKRWTARYFVRRTAWHVLDHAWEIEDRIE